MVMPLCPSMPGCRINNYVYCGFLTVFKSSVRFRLSDHDHCCPNHSPLQFVALFASQPSPCLFRPPTRPYSSPRVVVGQNVYQPDQWLSTPCLDTVKKQLMGHLSSPSIAISNPSVVAANSSARSIESRTARRSLMNFSIAYL